VDDLAFSGDAAPQILGPVIDALRKGGFSVSHQKIKIMGPWETKLLNKLVIGRFVAVQKEYVRRISAGIHNLGRGRVPESALDGYVASLEGSIGYLRLFDLKKAEKLREQLSLTCAHAEQSSMFPSREDKDRPE
jgi:hypothetical protein